MKIADSTPAFCSACYGQDPEAIYVDFESSWDGPIVDEGNGMKISIDDLVICETCLLAAANMNGLDSTKDLKNENLELGVLIEKMQVEIKEKDAMINDLSHTIAALIKTPVSKKNGRPKMMVTEDK